MTTAKVRSPNLARRIVCHAVGRASVTIAKHAIRDFLRRRLPDYSFLKRARKSDLLTELRSLRPRFRNRSKYPHYKHQLACLYMALCLPAALFLVDLGLGKTRIVLEAFAYRKRAREVKRGIIVVFNDVNMGNWVDEAAVHSPSLKVVSLDGDSSDERWSRLHSNPDADLFVVPYTSLLAMVNKARLTKAGKRRKGKFLLDQTKLRKLLRDVEFVAFDEIHLAKNHESATFRVCRAISHRTTYRYGLTGTPFGRDPQDMWALFYLIDHGATLGSTLGLFREAYFDSSTNYWGKQEYKLQRGSERKLHRAMRACSLVYADDECLDMPKRVYRPLRVQMSKAQRDYYTTLINEFVEAKSRNEIKNTFMHLRMLASGIIRTTTEDGTKLTEVIPDNPKLSALESVLEDLPAKAKLVVYYEFVPSGDVITKHLKAIGCKHVHVVRKMKTAERLTMLRQLKDKKDVRVLVVNSRIGSTGLNDMAVATYEFFYESPVSPITRKQCEGRIRRGNSKARRVYYYDAVVQGSVEERILDFIKEGKDLYRAIVRGKFNRKTLLEGAK
jgi:SNF2 family DNA or RNA helicase